MLAESLLQELGLSLYEAKAYVSLLSLGEATAKELSEYAKIPRTKIYEVLDKLEERGFIERQPSTPAIFRALEPRKTIGSMQRELIEKTQKCIETLEKIKAEKSKEISFVWIIRGRIGTEIKLKEFLGKSGDIIIAIFDPSFAKFLKETRNGKILLMEKFPTESENFRLIDRNKLNQNEFFRKFLEIIDGVDVEGANLQLSLIAVSQKKSLVIVMENKRNYITIEVRFPLVIFLQRVMLQTLWEFFSL